MFLDRVRNTLSTTLIIMPDEEMIYKLFMVWKIPFRYQHANSPHKAFPSKPYRVTQMI